MYEDLPILYEDLQSVLRVHLQSLLGKLGKLEKIETKKAMLNVKIKFRPGVMKFK